MRGLKQDCSARVVIAGHAFVQNLRRGHYELTVEAPTNRRVAVAFDELVLASDPAKVGLQPALGRRNATEPLAAIRRICDGVECAVPLDLSSMMPERLAALDALVERSQEILSAASLEARAMLQTGEEFGWKFVSLGPLPEGIASAGLFVLPARSRPTPHRHPNSIQHMRRLSGEARVRLALGDEVMDRSVGADERWVVIEADATHQIDVGDREFVVISFHTVPQEELLEVTETGQRQY